MKKALILGEVFYPEDFIINDLVHEWSERGYELEILTNVPSYPFGKVYEGYKNDIYQQTEFNGIKIHRFPIVPGYEKNRFLKILNYLCFLCFSSIIILFIGKRFDRIFVYHTGPLTLAVAAVLAKKIYGIPVTIWTQDLWPDTVYAYGFKKTRVLRLFLDGLVKFIYRNCQTILVSCEGFSEKLNVYVPNKKIHYVPNWPLINGVSDKEITLAGKFNFTFTGNIGKMQNLENIVLAFNIHVKKYEDSHLNIVGDGSSLAGLRKLVATNNISGVTFTGRRPLAEMPSFFKASQVLIISLINKPIYKITIPSKFQTYLTAAKPIFAVMDGEMKKIVEKNNLGLAVEPANIDAIAEGFDTFRTMKTAEFDSISSNATHLLKTEFQRETTLNKITNLFWA